MDKKDDTDMEEKRLTLLQGGLTDAFWRDHAAFLVCAEGSYKEKQKASVQVLNALYGRDGMGGAQPVVCASGRKAGAKETGLIVLTSSANEKAVADVLNREDLRPLKLTTRHRLYASDSKADAYRGTLMNALVKELFQADLSISDAVFSKGFAIRFVDKLPGKNHSDPDLMETVLDFSSTAGGLLNFRDMSHNMELVDAEHAQDFMFCYDENSKLGFVLGTSNKKELPRYQQKKRGWDGRKNTQVAFPKNDKSEKGSRLESRQELFYEAGGIAGKKNKVLRRIAESGYADLSPVVVKTQTVSYSIATKRHKTREQAQRALTERSIRLQRANTEGLCLERTRRVTPAAENDLIRAVQDITSPHYEITLHPQQGKGKEKKDLYGHAVMLVPRKKGMIREVLGKIRMLTYRLKPSDDPDYPGWMTRDYDGEKPSKTGTLLVYPDPFIPLDEFLDSVTLWDKTDGRKVPLAASATPDAVGVRAITAADDEHPYIGIKTCPDTAACRHHLILQAGKTQEEDPEYHPGYDRQYVARESVACDPWQLHYGAVLATVRKCLTELLNTKADLQENVMRSFPKGWGWTCVCRYAKRKDPEKEENTADKDMEALDPDDAVENARAQQDLDVVNVMIKADENGQITKSCINNDETDSMFGDFMGEGDGFVNRRKNAVFLESPSGKRMAIQKSALGTLLSDGGELSAYRHSLKDPGIFADGIRANVGYRYFSYNGNLYYEVGWDASDGLRQSYSSLPAIYQMFAPEGMTHQDWEDFFLLCDVGFVSSVSESTVLPAFAKYALEYRNALRDPETERASTFSKKKKKKS